MQKFKNVELLCIKKSYSKDNNKMLEIGNIYIPLLYYFIE